MSLFPIFQQLHVWDLWENAICQTTDQNQSSNAHVLSQVVSNSSFINFHEQSEYVLENDWRFLFETFVHDLFWCSSRFKYLLIEPFCLWVFFLEESVHHWNCWPAEWSLQTDVSDVMNVEVLLEKLYILNNFIINVWNVSVSSFRPQPVDSLSVPEWSGVKNWISKSSTRTHNA